MKQQLYRSSVLGADRWEADRLRSTSGPLVTAPHPPHSHTPRAHHLAAPAALLPIQGEQTQDVRFLCYLIEQNWAQLEFEVVCPLGQDGKVTRGTEWYKGQSKHPVDIGPPCIFL